MSQTALMALTTNIGGRAGIDVALDENGRELCAKPSWDCRGVKLQAGRPCLNGSVTHFECIDLNHSITVSHGVPLLLVDFQRSHHTDAELWEVKQIVFGSAFSFSIMLAPIIQLVL